jgi:branched-chain amino acid transport system permease protein
MRRAITVFNLVAVGILLFACVVIPQHANELRIQRLTYVGIYFSALVGLNILVGYSGQVSLGGYAFFGIGAYTTTLLTLGRPGMEAYGHNPPSWLPLGNGMAAIWTIPIAALVAGLFGYAFGLPAQRLAGVSLALATFAVAVSFPQILKKFENVTGGGGGLNLNLPETPFGLDVKVSHWLYYEAWATAGILALIAWLLLRGRLGRSLGALRDGEIAAVSAGINPTAYKTFAFGISAAYAGAAGGLFAELVAYVNPDTFPASQSIILLASLVLGGVGSMYGALIGAFAMEYLQIWSQNAPFVSKEASNQAPAVVFGVILILVMFVAPNGLVGLIRRLGRAIIQRLDSKNTVAMSQSRRAEA